MNTPLIETFSEYDKGINASWTKEPPDIRTNIKTYLIGADPQIHPNVCTPSLYHTDSS